jgi:hypothetical protein
VTPIWFLEPPCAKFNLISRTLHNSKLQTLNEQQPLEVSDVDLSSRVYTSIPAAPLSINGGSDGKYGTMSWKKAHEIKTSGWEGQKLPPGLSGEG